MELKKTGKELAAIVLIAAVPAVLLNLGLIRRQLKGDFAKSIILPEGTPGVAFIGLEEAGDLFQSGGALFIDSRPQDEYGAGHVPGANGLPLKEAEEKTISVTPEALEVPADRPLVVYCGGGDCQTSVLLRPTAARGGFPGYQDFRGRLGGVGKGGFSGRGWR